MSPPRLFDRSLLARRLDRAAKGFAQASFLRERAIEDLIHSLSGINRHFDVALEIGARDGAFGRELTASPAASKIGVLIESDLSERFSPRLVMDEEQLPFGDESLNLVVSTLALHTANDLPGVMVQIRRALKPDGLFIASLFGGETLKELRGCLMEAELEIRGGYGPRVAPFAEGPDLIDLLRRTGFNMPVVDSDRVVVSYEHPLKLMADLRAMGESNILIDRPRKGLNRAILARASELYFERFADDEGRIAATFEIITLSGWKPHESQQKPLRPGSARMRLADALGVKEGKI
ncbi:MULTISPECIES: methyltransferase domain-containing protein [Asticcacaulis]|uniref:methyltransferase domain-containing protein n=1 Tax=Asticcacaulis TaxID=76890 RepID=UPI001AE559E8|nr:MULTISPECIES: methyltransferase domain-containing protein [Asticcacaulis]MBP2158013.1 SAM-dependent methyltransferase [Asticcacaulis solisilvae]MDR6799058.1 SAM-dependent methyltransferase [Asticcacaulis sp. BE141]